MRIKEKLHDTPTVAWLKELASRAPKRKSGGYGFVLSDGELGRLYSAQMQSSGVVAYAVIRGAAHAAGRGRWVTVRPLAMKAVGKGYRWWHGATSRLEAAGFIECERHRGRLPRYRIVVRRAARKGPQS